MMQNFYGYLEEKGILDPPNVPEVLNKLTPKQLARLYEDCKELIESSEFDPPDSSIFNFSASSSICGSGENCIGVECRLKESTNLSVFATLYSDTVTMPNFFGHHIDSNKAIKELESYRNFYNKVKGDLIVLLHYKPLILSGILRINTNRLLYCRRCLARKVAKSDDSGIFQDETSRLQELAEKIIKENISLKLRSDGSFTVNDPKRYLSEGSSHVIPSYKTKKKSKKTILESATNEIVRERAFRIVDDIVLQIIMNEVDTSTYLTQRAIDPILINGAVSNVDSLQKIQDDSISVFANNMTHTLLFLENASPIEILQLREEEGEAFEVYRNSVKRVLKELGANPGKKLVHEALRDEIEPKIAKINQKIKANKKVARAVAAKKVTLSALAISVGAILQKKIPLDPTVVNLVLGSTGVGSALNDLAKGSTKPADVLESDYYFLWRLKQKVS